MTTMSARVLSPAVLSELRRLRVPKGGSGRAAAIAGVRRNLFGSPGTAARALADLELNRATDEGCRRWAFDFRSERPLPGRFDWKPIGRRPAALPAAADATPMEVETQPIQKVEEKIKPETQKIQTRITDFMKPRKRSATGGSAPPAKMARPSSAAAPAAEQRTTS